MLDLIRLSAMLFGSLLLMANVAIASGEPSPAAQSMTGAQGTIEFKPTDWKEGETTWWKDTRKKTLQLIV
jgi:hypothetical protein